jgi:hypothetical protein
VSTAVTVVGNGFSPFHHDFNLSTLALGTQHTSGWDTFGLAEYYGCRKWHDEPATALEIGSLSDPEGFDKLIRAHQCHWRWIGSPD